MRKVLFFLFVNVCFSFSTKAQMVGLERNKVLEFFQNQEYDEAIEYLLPVVSKDSLNIQLLSFMGYAHYMNDDRERAVRYYDRMLMLDSNNITALRYLADLYDNSHAQKAMLFTRRLIRLQPDKSVYYRKMGELLKQSNQNDSALSYYNQAYFLAPADTRNATGFATLLLEKKQYPRADSLIHNGLLKDSLHVDFLKLKIKSAYERKEFAQVISPGERLIRLQEFPLNALTQLALSFYNLKLYNDCVRVCEYMIANGLDTESTYYYEAKALAKLKQYEKSNELLRICLSNAISETAETYYYNLAQNYEALKIYKKAINNYDTAYYLFKDPLMNYNIGGIYEVNLKNEKLAYQYYQKYLLTAKPQTAEEKKAYEYVKSKQMKASGKK